MAAVGSRLVTIADVAKGDNARVNGVAEVLVKQNAMLKDIPYQVMNDGTRHIESIRATLPEVYYRKTNQPIPASKSVLQDREFTAAHFESKSQIDRAVAARGGQDKISWNRWVQAEGHIQAMANEHGDLTIYGSPSDDHRKTPGLTDIYSTLATTEETSKQIINAGGTGNDNMSIWLIHWGAQSVFGVFPEGTTAGLRREDHGIVQIHGVDELGNNGTFWGYEEEFMMDHGLVVKDYRQVARIANIDISELQDGTVDAADLLDLMTDASYTIDSAENGTGVWYMNRTAEAFLHKQALDKVSGGGGVTYDNYQGEKVLTFLGRPIRRVDQLLTSEAAVTA